jgi:hypothetical protein
MRHDRGTVFTAVILCSAKNFSRSPGPSQRHLNCHGPVRAGEAATLPVALKALDSRIEYVRPRLAIMDYVEYRAKGYVIGSGLMKSTC